MNKHYTPEYYKRYREKHKDKIRESNKKWRENHKEYVNQKQKEWRTKNREEINRKARIRYSLDINAQLKWKKKHHELRMLILTHYGGNPPKCKCCGEALLEFLTLDHINGGGTDQRRKLRGTNFYRQLKKQGFPEGFRILCMNCNFSLGHSGYCPHGNL